MADQILQEQPLLPGSVHAATVEAIINNVLVVCLRHETKHYRGVLLDATNRDIPYGLDINRGLFSTPMKGQEAKETPVVVPPSESEMKAQVSSTVLRHTYLMDSTAVDKRLLPPSKAINKPIRDKHVRNMRLRPRQVLCANCQKGIHENKVEGSTVDVATADSNSNKNEMKKRKATVLVSEAAEKKLKTPGASFVPRTCPRLKISFATPKGGDTVEVKIPPRTLSPEPQMPKHSAVTKELTCDITKMTHHEYKAYKKALKKAKQKGKYNATDPNMDEKLIKRLRKKAKHKLKRKHKHRHHDRIPEQDENGIENQDSSNEYRENVNIQDTTDSYSTEAVSHFGFNDSLDCGDRSREDNEDTSSNASSRDENMVPQSPIRSKKNKPLLSPQNREETFTDYSTDNNWSKDDDIDLMKEQNKTSENEAPGIKPLMMKIQTKPASQCEIPDGRKLHIGDIVWGKIHGFPWWPGRILSISIKQKDNGVVITQMAHVSWFGSSTMSHMQSCDLYPFLEDYKNKFNKKKRGPYKTAIKQAITAAKAILGLDVNLEELTDS